MTQFRYRLMEQQLILGDHLIEGEDIDSWLAPLEIVAQGSLASLRKAILALAGNYEHDNTRDRWGMLATVGSLAVSPIPAIEFDEDYSPRESVTIGVLADGQLVVDIVVGLLITDVDVDDMETLLAPLLARSAASFMEAQVEGSGSQCYFQIRLAFGPRGATVQDAIDVGLDVAALVDCLSGGELTAESALDLVTAGRADLLVGLAESRWLEVKSQGYDLQNDEGRIELAQDVARFANGDEPGLLIVGLRTRKIGGDDVITKTCPAPDAFDAARHARAIDAKLFPPVQGLVVRNLPARPVNGRSGYMLAIYVPTQPEEMKPFLVHGAIIDGKVEGAFISIVQRRGEHSIPVTAPAIHATLAAGRALLRRGEAPIS